MSLPQINTTPLFRNSLKSWQASYKANQAGAAESGRPDRSHRLGLRKRRARGARTTPAI